MKIKLLSLVLVALLASGFAQSALAGACNSLGCWSMEVDQFRVDAASGAIFVRFSDQGNSALDNIDTAICSPQPVHFGQVVNTIKLTPSTPAYDEFKQIIMTAYMFTGHRLGFSVYDPDPNDSDPYCEFKSIDIVDTLD